MVDIIPFWKFSILEDKKITMGISPPKTVFMCLKSIWWGQYFSFYILLDDSLASTSWQKLGEYSKDKGLKFPKKKKKHSTELGLQTVGHCQYQQVSFQDFHKDNGGFRSFFHQLLNVFFF